MSSRTRGRKDKVRKQSNIELSSIITFIKLIQAIFAGMLGISLIGILLSLDNEEAKVLYTICITISLFVVIFGRIPIRYLSNKSSNS
ncbi:hypothetical protein [Clostridium sartagoforme]|uniref:hypothetical protein n=1 Tax=Clostridium sartagoforme TaxID=84031 RepID=UPI0031E38CB0